LQLQLSFMALSGAGQLRDTGLRILDL
jgi:hypothetical protein